MCTEVDQLVDNELKSIYKVIKTRLYSVSASCKIQFTVCCNPPPISKSEYWPERQRTYKHNSEARSCNHCCCAKTISITYSECVFVALGIQHAIPYIMLSSMAWPALQNFSTLSHKRHDLKKKQILNIKFVFSFSAQTLSKHFLV
jgi:hypothetical protein